MPKWKIENPKATPHRPYNQITCFTKGEKLGHMMGPNPEMNSAIAEGIKKGKIAWLATRGKLKTT